MSRFSGVIGALRARRVTFVLATAVCASLLAGVAYAAVGFLGWRCVEHESRQGFGSPVVGIASRSQIPVHYRAVLNRFSANCRPDTQGIITLAGDSDEAVVSAALIRSWDALYRRYLLYGLARPLTTDEKAQIEQDASALLGRTSPVHQIPLWIEGIAIGYSLDCDTGNQDNALKLTSKVLSGIYDGTLTSWDDPLLWSTGDNPGLQDCHTPIRPAVRSDASSQTAVFKDYLAKRNSHWAAYEQPQMNTRWPPLLLSPCRGRGDGGMASCVAGEPGSIGYVGFAEAKRRGLRVAHVENAAHRFVEPSQREFTAAAEAFEDGPGAYPTDTSADWSQTTITDQPSGYPIAGLQFGFAFRVMAQAYGGRVGTTEVRSVRDYLFMALSDQTQARIERYGVARLPRMLRDIARNGAEGIEYLQ